MQDKEYAQDSDIQLSGEDDLTELLEKEIFDLIIADSDAFALIKSTGYSGGFIDYPEFAVSGRLLGWHKIWPFGDGSKMVKKAKIEPSLFGSLENKIWILAL